MPIAIPNKPHVFTLYTLSPDVRAYAEQFFRLTSPEDEGFDEWREKAEGIMVRSVEVTEEDVAGMVRCRFVGKHGVGVDKLAVKALKAKGVVLMNTAGVNVSGACTWPASAIRVRVHTYGAGLLCNAIGRRRLEFCCRV